MWSVWPTCWNPLTLFTQCPLVLTFWSEVKDYLAYFFITLPIARLQILFGIHSETFDSTNNIIILIGKRVIWVSKFQKIPPSINLFKKYLKDYLIVLSYCHSIKNTRSVFEDQWGTIFWILAGHHGPNYRLVMTEKMASIRKTTPCTALCAVGGTRPSRSSTSTCPPHTTTGRW